jgi:plasmid stability protein
VRESCVNAREQDSMESEIRAMLAQMVIPDPFPPQPQLSAQERQAQLSANWMKGLQKLCGDIAKLEQADHADHLAILDSNPEFLVLLMDLTRRLGLILQGLQAGVGDTIDLEVS